MNEIDPRIVKLGIEVSGVLKVYEGLWISATGMKFSNSNQGQCDIKIANLSNDTRERILTEVSPFNLNKTPKRVILYAGRVSTGATEIFRGDIITASPSQPPDITITIKALTGAASNGDIVVRSAPPQQGLRALAEGVAADLGATLEFQAEDKQIANYSFTGGAFKQVEKLGDTGEVDAFLDGNKLVVKPRDAMLSGRARILDKSSGMVGIPEITAQGVKVKFLLDNETVIGGGLIIKSDLNPAASGSYAIYQLSFEIASRDTPFYWVACGRRL